MSKFGIPVLLMATLAIGVPGLWADSSLGSAGRLAPRIDQKVGEIRHVSGDLVYVQGLSGSAPVWSQLRVLPGNGRNEVGTLEVIKDLGEMLVARVLSDSGEQFKVHSRVMPIEGSPPPGHRARRIVYAENVPKGPRLDGRLDDPVWLEARAIEGFVQRDPDYWMPSTERTVVRILYDEEKIYFGFECFLSDSGRVVANNMRRDSSLRHDDNVQILLDTYNDRQTGFFFFVNPLGAQRDIILSEGGRTSNGDWDCIWEVRTRQHATGWTAEIAIPLNQLRFRLGEPIVWGINLGRNISYKNEEVRLVVGGGRASSSRARYWTSDIGELRGLEGLRSRRLLNVTPYMLPGTSIDREGDNPEENPSFESGVDLRYGLTPNLTADLSYNTDFAQVEGDQEQVNLSQFSLFFPEKRGFFLEGANLFDFGEAAEDRSGGTLPPTLLFYSRRIGLEEDRPVPVRLATKIVGKANRTSVGALNVLTDSRSFTEDGDSLFIPRSNFSAIRVKRDLLARSNVGFIFVNKQSKLSDSGWGHYNRAGGVDFSYSPAASLSLQGFVARTWDSETGTRGNAQFGRLIYCGNRLSGKLGFLNVDPEFEPAVGFVNRREGLEGFRRYFGRMKARPRPGLGGIRYFSIGPEFNMITDRENRVKSLESELSWWTIFNSGHNYQIAVTTQHEEVDEPFAPSDRREEVEIPAGSYTFTTFTTGPWTDRSRKAYVRIRLQAGGYFTGHRFATLLEGEARPTGRFSVGIRHVSNWIRLPQGKLSLNTLGARVIYSLTTDFFFKLFAQWNNDKELVSTNFLVNYRFRPGSNLFFVFDQAFGTESGIAQRNRAVLMKIAYQVGI